VGFHTKWKKIALPNNVDAVVFKTSSYLVAANFNFPAKNRCTSGCSCAVCVEFKLPFQDNLLAIPMKVKGQLGIFKLLKSILSLMTLSSKIFS
jgi:hypothetical protein